MTAPENPDAALAVALATFQAAMPVVAKTQTAKVPTKAGGSYSYTYAGLPDVTEAVMPRLAAHGLSFSVCPHVTDHGTIVEGVLMHQGGGRLTAALPLHGNTPQEIGSALTYARRYLLGAMTGVVTDDDDDGQAAQRSSRNDQPHQRAPQPGQPVSDAQLRALHATLNAAGISSRDEGLAKISELVGAPIESTRDLTRAQASVVIDALKQQAVA